jgi:protein MpaA
VAPAGSPYRYVAIAPSGAGITVVARIRRRGGRVERWWRLRGSYSVPALAYDGTGGGLSADGRTLFLVDTPTEPDSGGWTSRFAILDTAVFLRHPGTTLRHAVRRLALHGDFRFAAISPHGGTAYLYRLPADGDPSVHQIRALDLASGRLLPRPVSNWGRHRAQVEGGPLRSHAVSPGLPISATVSADGRRAYTLFDGNGKHPSLQMLDTVRGSVVDVPLPQLRGVANPFMLGLSLRAHERRLAVVGRPPSLSHRVTLLSIDTATLRPHPRPQLQLARANSRFLAFLRTARRPGNLLARAGVAGYSLRGTPIEIRQLGDPAIRRRVLVFACIHGDECAGGGIAPVAFGCPDPRADIYLVPRLDPDGAAAGSRLNARGVDLNRNFSVAWRPRGRRWSSEYSGPGPFSEPESRLAARIVRWVKPTATLWLHQHHGSRPFVRAWGQSVPPARRFARLAGIPFRRMHWLAGTAPNWQNHRFPGTSSFVVELPWGRLSPGLKARLGAAIDRLARQIAGVGED